MKIAIERIFTSKLRQNAAIEPIFSTFMRDAPSPHITFRDGRSVPPPPPPLSWFVYGPVNDSAIGIWLITLELILTEEPILTYLDKIRL